MKHKTVPDFHSICPEKGKIGKKSFKVLNKVSFYDAMKLLIKLDHVYQDDDKYPEAVKGMTLELFRGSKYCSLLHNYLKGHHQDTVTHEAAIQYVIMFVLKYGNRKLPESYPSIPQNTLHIVGECLLKAGNCDLDELDSDSVRLWMTMQTTFFASYDAEYRCCVYWEVYAYMMNDPEIATYIEAKLGCSFKEYFCILLSIYGRFCTTFPFDKTHLALDEFPFINLTGYKNKLKNPFNIRHVEDLILPSNYKPTVDNFYLHTYSILKTPLIKLGDVVVPISRKLLNRSLFDGIHFRLLSSLGELEGRYSERMGKVLENWVLDLCRTFEENVYSDQGLTIKKGETPKTVDINILYPEDNAIILIEVKKTVPMNEQTLRANTYSSLQERIDDFFKKPTDQLNRDVAYIRQGIIQWTGINRDAEVYLVCIHHTTPLIMGANKCSYSTNVEGHPIEYMDIVHLSIIKNAVNKGKISSFKELIVKKRESKLYSWSDFLHTQGLVEYERDTMDKFYKSNFRGEDVFYQD